MAPLLLCLLPAGAAAQARRHGANLPVGSYRLHVQIQQQRVTVQRQGVTGLDSAGLNAAFAGWDAQSSTVRVSVAVTNTGRDTLFAPLHVRVTRIASPNVTVLNADAGTGAGSWSWQYAFGQLPTGAATPPKEWHLHNPWSTSFQVDVEITAGVPVRAGEAATITTPDGISLTIPAGSLPYDALIDIESLPPDDLGADEGDFEVIAAFRLTFDPGLIPAGLDPPLYAFQVTVPAPTDAGRFSRILVAQEILIDSLTRSGQNAAPVPQFMPVAVASLQGAVIMTQSNPTGVNLIEIKGDGVFALLGTKKPLFGWATGIVSDSKPRPGSMVSNNANSLVTVTDHSGRYDLFVDGLSAGGAFMVFGFNALLGKIGTGYGAIMDQGGTAVADIDLSGISLGVPARPGVRNAGFERGDASSWAMYGSADAMKAWSTSIGWLRPSEGIWMGYIDAGDTADSTGAILENRFTVPAGTAVLRYDYNFVTEDDPSFAPGKDIIRVILRAGAGDMAGDTLLVQHTVSDIGGLQSAGNCFPSAKPCLQSGWRTGWINLSGYAGGTDDLRLIFTIEEGSAADIGTPAATRSRLLVDNLRFSTLRLKTNIVPGTNHLLQDITRQVADANELLSQAGINLQMGDWALVDNIKGALLDVDCSPDTYCPLGQPCKLLTTPEQNALLAQKRSPVSTDLHVYYVRNISGLSAAGLAVGPDDYYQFPPKGHWGMLMESSIWGDVLAHEVGHLLISPHKAGDSLEHKVSDPANFMKGSPTVPRTNLAPKQSEVMNNSLYLVP